VAHEWNRPSWLGTILARRSGEETTQPGRHSLRPSQPHPEQRSRLRGLVGCFFWQWSVRWLKDKTWQTLAGIRRCHSQDCSDHCVNINGQTEGTKMEATGRWVALLASVRQHVSTRKPWRGNRALGQSLTAVFHLPWVRAGQNPALSLRTPTSTWRVPGPRPPRLLSCAMRKPSLASTMHY
jgi:hypothetical protein